MLTKPKKIHVELDYDTRAEMLEKTVWSNDLSWKQIKILSQFFEPFTITDGGIIFNEGDPGESLCVLTKGKVGIYKNDKLLSTLAQGRSFGEIALIDHEPRSATVVSIGNSQFVTINRANFERLSQEHPALALQFVTKIACLLSQRLRQTTGQLADFV